MDDYNPQSVANSFEQAADRAADTALIACGALAREVIAIRDKYDWAADVLGIPALLHNWPRRIPPAVQKRIAELRTRYERLIVVYGDCGTAGRLDGMLEAEGVERVAGPHCYEMYADGLFDETMAEAPGTYFLTDYLVQSFDHLVIEGMGLDDHPELLETYFRHYTRVLYLAQRDDPALLQKAQQAADYLRLPLEVRPASYGALESRLVALMESS
ncbi:MAG: DUF1638 domain-containing protein [Candidatus Promineifilaceae bacterium]|jgi:hypothetical protein